MTAQEQPRLDVMSIKDLVAAGYGSKPHIYRQIAKGKFPRPIRIGARKVGWRRSAILAHLDRLSKVA